MAIGLISISLDVAHGETGELGYGIYLIRRKVSTREISLTGRELSPLL